jgi:hypothetical protein
MVKSHCFGVAILNVQKFSNNFGPLAWPSITLKCGGRDSHLSLLMELDLLSDSRKPRRTDFHGNERRLADAVKRLLDMYIV